MTAPVKITLRDRALYFKGLLLVIRRDGVIGDSERGLLLAVGRAFDYETEFCETTIRDALINPYLLDDPPRFSGPEIAACFVRDGLRLAAADGSVHPAETVWLEETARLNGLSPDWFRAACAASSVGPGPAAPGDLEALNLRWT
jgi:hypothetical protein